MLVIHNIATQSLNMFYYCNYFAGVSWHGSSFKYRVSDDNGESWYWIPQVHISVCEKDTIQDAASTVAIIAKNIEMFCKAQGNEHIRECYLTMDNAGAVLKIKLTFNSIPNPRYLTLGNYHCEGFIRCIWSLRNKFSCAIKGIIFQEAGEGLYRFRNPKLKLHCR